MAEQPFAKALPPVTAFTSPRAWAFRLMGIHEYLGRLNGGRLAKGVREELIQRLVAIFSKIAEPGWTWLEEGLADDNAKLAQALIVSARATGQLRPIGSNGFHKRNGAHADFGQRPIEAQTTVSACLEAYRATADAWWYEQAHRAFDWSAGWNDLRFELAAPFQHS